MRQEAPTGFSWLPGLRDERSRGSGGTVTNCRRHCGARPRLAGNGRARRAEEKRDAEQKAKVEELRKRFVDRPVLVLPNAGGSFSSSGITPIPGVGTVFPEVHVTAEWGTLQAAQALRPDNRSNITVPAPASVQGSTRRRWMENSSRLCGARRE
jgi:hypothetical protein